MTIAEFIKELQKYPQDNQLILESSLDYYYKYEIKLREISKINLDQSYIDEDTDERKETVIAIY